MEEQNEKMNLCIFLWVNGGVKALCIVMLFYIVHTSICIYARLYISFVEVVLRYKSLSKSLFLRSMSSN